MSSILKALKKVEKERGPLQGGTSPVAREILSDLPRPGKRSGSRSRWALISFLLLVGGAFGGVLLMQQNEVVIDQPSPQVVDIAPAAAPESPAEPPVVAFAKTEPVPPAPVVQEVKTETPVVVATPDTVKIAEEMVMNTRDAAADLKETAATLRATADKLKNKVIISSKSAAELTAKSERKSVAVAPPSPKPVAVVKPTMIAASKPVSGAIAATGSGASRNPGWYLSDAGEHPAPALKVTEIHWKPVAKDRLAVVNDLPVLEGVDIEGARVDRIFKDRIRFIVNGRYVEIKVNSAPAR